MSTEENVSIDVNEEKTQQPTTQTTTVSDRMVNIPLSLVVRCSNIIENLSTRGCFRANELSEVGALYNNLKQLVINAVNEIKEEQTAEEQTTEQTAEEQTTE